MLPDNKLPHHGPTYQYQMYAPRPFSDEVIFSNCFFFFL